MSDTTTTTEAPTMPEAQEQEPKDLLGLLLKYWGKGDAKAPLRILRQERKTEQVLRAEIAIAEAVSKKYLKAFSINGVEVGRAALALNQINRIEDFKGNCSQCVQDMVKRIHRLAEERKESLRKLLGIGQASSPASGNGKTQQSQHSAPTKGDYIYHVDPSTGAITMLMTIQAGNGNEWHVLNLSTHEEQDIPATECHGTPGTAHTAARAIVNTLKASAPQQ